MFPNPSYTKIIQRQRGFLLPLALFILVVMGALALTISRTSIQTQTSSIQELMNVQAFYAGESGAQQGMQELFFHSDIKRLSVNDRCTNLDEKIINFTANGLKTCTAEVDCAFTIDEEGIRSFYTITSIGRCGEGQYRAERTIEVGSFIEGAE
jgi:MSHA biogenesis protein MshP